MSGKRASPSAASALSLRALLALAAACSRASPLARRAGLRQRQLPPALNAFPTIGILSVPISSADSPCETEPRWAANRSSCFTTFYIRWVESAGARAVLIPYDSPPAVLAALLDSVNGVLLTGGELEDLAFDTPYMVAAASVLAAARAKAAAGVFWPVHGSCQGMQVLSLLVAGDQAVLSKNAFDAENYSLPLDATWDGHHSSRLLSADTAPADAVATLTGSPSTLNLHHDGVRVADFAASDALGAFFVLVSTNFDRRGAAFVSTLEAWELPIVATQWHPERPQFEWRAVGADHSAATIRAMQYVASFFVDDARRNNQTFTDAALFAKYSVFSYPVVSAGDAATSGYQYIVFTD